MGEGRKIFLNHIGAWVRFPGYRKKEKNFTWEIYKSWRGNILRLGWSCMKYFLFWIENRFFFTKKLRYWWRECLCKGGVFNTHRMHIPLLDICNAKKTFVVSDINHEDRNWKRLLISSKSTQKLFCFSYFAQLFFYWDL